MKRVCDKLGDGKALLATVHGVWASCSIFSTARIAMKSGAMRWR
ncbi:MAG: hypothetical protein ACLUMK_14645 [Christensenellales bacterium]